MTTLVAEANARPGSPNPARRPARAGLWAGATTTVAFTCVWFFATLSPDGEPFQHAGDYWYTGLGLPLVLTALVVVQSLHLLADGRDGRLGRVGMIVSSCALIAFVGPLAGSLVDGAERSWGPTYVLATFVSIIGLALFCAGVARARLLPRWMLLLWVLSWTVGGMLGPMGSQLLLGAVYVMLAMRL